MLTSKNNPNQLYVIIGYKLTRSHRQEDVLGVDLKNAARLLEGFL